jgi:hypothetical protein
MIVTADQLRELIRRDEAGTLKLLARVANDSNQAKNLLREAGYGWTGLNVVETVKQALKATAA